MRFGFQPQRTWGFGNNGTTSPDKPSLSAIAARGADVFVVAKREPCALGRQADGHSFRRWGVSASSCAFSSWAWTPSHPAASSGRRGWAGSLSLNRMLQRQGQGIAKAKSVGKYKGGEPFAPERRWKVLQLAVEGAPKKKRMARRRGRGKPSCIEFRQLPEEWCVAS